MKPCCEERTSDRAAMAGAGSGSNSQSPKYESLHILRHTSISE